MASAAYELSAKYNIDITRRSTLLIDDDFRNIQIALKYKTPAIRFVPEDVDKYVCMRIYDVFVRVYVNVCMHVYMVHVYLCML